MPVKVKKKGTKFRVVEADTGNVSKNEKGTPVDGGGHAVQAKAERQARAINSSLSKAGKI